VNRHSLMIFDMLGSVSARTARRPLETEICCAPVSAEVLHADQAASLAVVFAALADPIRLRLFSIIANAGGGEACACDLVEPSGRSQPTISHHMKILVDAGLVTREKRSLWVWYRVVPEQLDALRAALG
jgi:ArsR family transcriptional regulator, arsenate/arsenite/antimonite-responsive transcriptional repressor